MQKNAASSLTSVLQKELRPITTTEHCVHTTTTTTTTMTTRLPKFTAGLTFSKIKNKKQPQSFSNHYSKRLSADTSKNSEKSQVSSMVHHRHRIFFTTAKFTDTS
ncbi:uncharacterized protein tafa5l isoform X2 [Xyrichtys novacula]|uniref:Uncharacterized protein tafa5l isoform X2 n=1 Tax=Xyrichtys novacula TaxID=13765 RepID=A0AAV1F2E2_XYRNO|nr:uncharacterized protein tafa5l isoform X2 [Xyrichtys novacula]